MKYPNALHKFVRLGVLLAIGTTGLFTPLSQAQLVVDVTGAGSARLPIAIADFSGERVIGSALTSVVRADLERSGLFKLIDAPTPVGAGDTPPYADLKTRGADALLGGTVTASSDGRYETRLTLSDVPKQASIAAQTYGHTSAQLRATAHRISDFVYSKLTGEQGIFSTRIAYIVKLGGRYELQIADADGGNSQSALASNESIISPAWSPDGSKLAYVSFEAKKPVIYVHDLATGRRHVAANFKGSNSAPAWSPDGLQLAVVLTKDGGSQIFLVGADGSGLRRLATSASIDTEPRFSPDGGSIYFSSDRGGSPQIYRISVTGGQAERITFEGSYNVSPRLSPDGKSMAYITRVGGLFHVALMDLASKQVTILTDSAKDESPSFAPNGRMIVYATEVNGKGVLAAVSVDGRVKQRLSSALAADVREPAWAPFNR
ncbi:MAG: Tol-Pal system protein TolB [Rhodocyclaceae bacterium]|nr:Tol-Pal system protein TolB [Rhodocyclaceae bacterium]MBP6110495.1 Tol-Pal system protein TolB [Rhodocyclaceae bacterium]MBP6279673.1 Tol-Pal system protein TolB [Rhodocyclaceae bacterium]